MSARMESPQLSAEYLAADKGGGTLVLTTLFPALALITVGLRLYTRFNIVRIPSHEDYAIALAMVSMIHAFLVPANEASFSALVV